MESQQKFNEIVKLEKSKGWKHIVEALQWNYDQYMKEVALENPSPERLTELRAKAKVCHEMQRFPEKLKMEAMEGEVIEKDNGVYE